MDKPITVGRIVHYVLPDGPYAGDVRPAIVVRVWNQDLGAVNLQVFTDQSNDGFDTGVVWATSVVHDQETKKPRTWHWPEY